MLGWRKVLKETSDPRIQRVHRTRQRLVAPPLPGGFIFELFLFSCVCMYVVVVIAVVVVVFFLMLYDDEGGGRS